jgi:hypothetical protein
VPPAHVSAPLQYSPSSHGLPAGSFPEHPPPESLHDSEQSLSPSAPGHSLPVWTVQKPPEHVSVPLQSRPSLHVVPFASAAVHVSFDSLQLSEQFPSPSGPVHGSPA